MEYKIVQSTGNKYEKNNVIRALEEYVNNNIKEGWKPIGGVSITKFDGDLYLVATQAMIKE